MSFIYRDLELLSKLFKIGQEANYTSAELKHTLQSLFDNLQTNLSRSFSDLTPEVLVNLSTLIKWLVDTKKTFNGQRIAYAENELQNVSTQLQLKTVEGAKILTSAFTGFIADLQSKAQDPILAQLVNNLVNQAQAAGLISATTTQPPATTTQPTITPPEQPTQPTKTPVSTPTSPPISVQDWAPFSTTDNLDLDRVAELVHFIRNSPLRPKAEPNIENYENSMQKLRNKLGTEQLGLIPIKGEGVIQTWNADTFSQAIDAKHLTNKDLSEVAGLLSAIVNSAKIMLYLMQQTPWGRDKQTTTALDMQIRNATDIQIQLQSIANQFLTMATRFK